MRFSARLTQTTRFTPRDVSVDIIASMSAPNAAGESLYPSSTTARSRFGGSAAATCTPLDTVAEATLVRRLTAESNDDEAKVPSVTIRRGAVSEPATPTPIESPMYAMVALVEFLVTTRTVKPGDGSPLAPRKSQACWRNVFPFEPVRTRSLYQMPS